MSTMTHAHGNHTADPHTELEHIIMSGTLVFIFLATLVGNIMVCLAVYRRRKLRTRTNMYMINLSCADIGVAVVCMPFSLITCLNHDWVLGDVLCNLNGFMNIVFTQTSLLSLTAISVETYLAICKPMYHRHMSRKFAMSMLAWTWIQPVVIACVPFFGISRYEFKPGTIQCAVQFPTNLVQTIYAACVILFGFVIPLGIMGFTYSNIFRSARRYARRASRVSISSTASVSSTTAHRQVAVTVLILLVMFILCWLPYFTFVILVSVDKSLASDRTVLNLGKAAYWCAFTSSALNPYIYGFRNPQFRKEFQFLFCLFCPCISSSLRLRGCSATSGSKGSWDEPGFDYNYLRRPSYPNACATPKGRMSVDFAPFPAKQVEKFEMLALQAKMSNYSDPGYCSQEERGVARSGSAMSDDSYSNNNKNNNNISDVEQSSSKVAVANGGLDHKLTNDRKSGEKPSIPSEDSCNDQLTLASSNQNQALVVESNIAETNIPTHDGQESNIRISSGSCSSDQSTSSLGVEEPRVRDLSTSPSELLMTPVRPRRWSFKALGARLKLGWIESAL